jgi:hypothetical protein
MKRAASNKGNERKRAVFLIGGIGSAANCNFAAANHRFRGIPYGWPLRESHADMKN